MVQDLILRSCGIELRYEIQQLSCVTNSPCLSVAIAPPWITNSSPPHLKVGNACWCPCVKHTATHLQQGCRKRSLLQAQSLTQARAECGFSGTMFSKRKRCISVTNSLVSTCLSADYGACSHRFKTTREERDRRQGGTHRKHRKPTATEFKIEWEEQSWLILSCVSYFR